MTDEKAVAEDVKISAAQAVLDYQTLIEKTWAALVVNSLEQAAKLDEPILFNYVPTLLKKLSEALDPQTDRANAIEGNTSAQEHGAERVRLTNYGISDVVIELQLLKAAIYTTLEDKITLQKDDRGIIEKSIDAAIRDSVTAFVLAEARFRERYIAMLAHDIRSPVAFIAMAAQIVKDEVHDRPEAHELVERILDNATIASQLIQNILDANLIRESVKPKLNIQSVDILEIVKSCAKNWGSKVAISGKELVGYWSAEDLARAIGNLIENANKYGDKLKPIAIDIEEAHGAMKLHVHNEGPPIPPEEQENIFQPLRRAKEAKKGGVKGWGFGLPIVRRIAEAHGGTIAVDSTLDKGTTFTLQLPMDSRPFQNVPILE